MTNSINSSETTKDFPPKPIDPIGSVQKYLYGVIFITTTLLILGSIAVLAKVKPSFCAAAIIKIEPEIPKILYGKEEASITPYYNDFVSTQINIVKSFPVLSRAIQLFQEQGFGWQAPGESLERTVARFANNLNVEQMRGTQLFSISMNSRHKEGLAEQINAVAAAYLEANNNEVLNKDSSKLSFLTTRKEEIENKLAADYSILQNISAKYAVGITDEKNLYVYLQAIVDLTQQTIKATTKKIEVESQLKELQNQLETLKNTDISSDIDEWVEQDLAVRDNRMQLSRKLQDMNLVLSGVNQDHPDRKIYEENLAKLYEVQSDLLQRAREVGEKVIRGRMLSQQYKKILDLETENAAAFAMQEKLQSKLLEAEMKATDVNTQMMKAATLRKNIQRLQDSLLRIDGRIDEIEVESRSPGRITLMAKARTPENASSSNRLKMLIIVVLSSLGAGLGYTIVKDKLDDRIHMVKDIERVLGFPATGHILDAGQDLEHVDDPYRVVLDNSFSLLSEQYNEISLTFSMDHDSHKSRIYTCLSMAEGQGASSFLTNILCTLKAKEKKKIFVDLNIWNPLSKILVPQAEYGLWDVLDGKRDLKDTIITESRYPFHILPFGNWRSGDKSIFQELGFEVLIESLRLEYEYIMIDSPPFFLTSESKLLARLADVVILVVKAEEVREKELFRAVNMLDKIHVKAISVVLNRAELLRGKYYRDVMERYYRLITPIRKNEISFPNEELKFDESAFSWTVGKYNWDIQGMETPEEHGS